MQALRAFESAARHLSIMHAAEELHVTPGAISRQILALETLLGGALFHRHHRRIEITRLGAEFLNDIRTPLARIGAATERARQVPDHGTVSLCAYPTFAIRWFIPRWGRFYDRHPGINIQLATSLAPVDFTRDNHDMAIQVFGGDGVPAGLQAHPLVDVATLPVCAPHVAAGLREPRDLEKTTLLHSEPRRDDWPRWLKHVGLPNVRASDGLRFESLNLAFQAAIEGLGVAMGIEALVQDDLARGNLVRPFDGPRRPSRPMQLVYRSSQLQRPSFRAFRDWLLEEAAGG